MWDRPPGLSILGSGKVETPQAKTGREAYPTFRQAGRLRSEMSAS